MSCTPKKLLKVSDILSVMKSKKNITSSNKRNLIEVLLFEESDTQSGTNWQMKPLNQYRLL